MSFVGFVIRTGPVTPHVITSTLPMLSRERRAKITYQTAALRSRGNSACGLCVCVLVRLHVLGNVYMHVRVISSTLPIKKQKSSYVCVCYIKSVCGR